MISKAAFDASMASMDVFIPTTALIAITILDLALWMKLRCRRPGGGLPLRPHDLIDR